MSCPTRLISLAPRPTSIRTSARRESRSRLRNGPRMSGIAQWAQRWSHPSRILTNAEASPVFRSRCRYASSGRTPVPTKERGELPWNISLTRPGIAGISPGPTNRSTSGRTPGSSSRYLFARQPATTRRRILPRCFSRARARISPIDSPLARGGVTRPDRQVRVTHHEVDSSHFRRPVPFRNQAKEGLLPPGEGFFLLHAEVLRDVALPEK